VPVRQSVSIERRLKIVCDKGDAVLSWFPVVDLDWKSWLLQVAVVVLLAMPLVWVFWRRFGYKLLTLVGLVVAVVFLLTILPNIRCAPGAGGLGGDHGRGNNAGGIDQGGNGSGGSSEGRSTFYDIEAKVHRRSGGWILELRRTGQVGSAVIVQIWKIPSWRKDLRTQCGKIRSEPSLRAGEELRARLEVPRAFPRVGRLILIDELMAEGIRVVETATK